MARKAKITKADQYFSLWVRLRDKWTCQKCSKEFEVYENSKGWPTAGPGLHCSHFKGRGKEATRFEPLNADSLCYGCHSHFTAQPDEHYQWQVKTKGRETVDKIILASHGYKKKDRKLEEFYWREKLLEDFGIKV